MRILFLTPSVRPLGARRSLVELIRNLPSHIEPMCVCPAEEGIFLELKELGVPLAVAPHGAWRKLFGRLKAYTTQLPRIGGIVGRWQPDVIHANEFHIVPQAYFGSGRQFPLCGHVRLTVRTKDLTNYHLDACRRIVAVSQAVRSLFPEPLRNRVRVVYNGVDVCRMTSEGTPHELAAPLLEESGGKRPLVVGLFGLVSERKNQLVAAEAVAAARARGADVRLLLAGEAFKGSMAYGEVLRARLCSPALTNAALWLPFQQDPAPLYRSIDVNLLISGEEGFGRTIIEAGAARRPSIGARTGGIPELIDDGVTGWLVDAGNVEQLADLLVRLAANPGVVAEAGAVAQLHVLRNFTIEAHVRKMIEVWEECRGTR